uniref:Uncharacterized protein n=1 Tax=Anguilla anguilla TaxID=7936 RepID=A0A0E9SUB6_ANGAN
MSGVHNASFWRVGSV